jgi:hypothetical protein
VRIVRRSDLFRSIAHEECQFPIFQIPSQQSLLGHQAIPFADPTCGPRYRQATIIKDLENHRRCQTPAPSATACQSAVISTATVQHLHRQRGQAMPAGRRPLRQFAGARNTLPHRATASVSIRSTSHHRCGDEPAWENAKRSRVVCAGFTRRDVA